MTTKQIQTLLLFAQNYSLVAIAKKMRVSLTTIRQRIKALGKNYSKEFGNAVALRRAYKRDRDAIRNAKDFSNFHSIDVENISKWGY